MNFRLNDEEEAMRRSIRAALDSRGSFELARRFVRGDRSAAEETWSTVAAVGGSAVLVPETDGGLGLGHVALIPIMEELGRVLAPGPFPETLAFAPPLLAGSNGELRTELRRIADGSAVLALAYSGPAAAAADRTGQYAISGTGLIASHADVASLLVVPVRLPSGETCACVLDAHAPGVTVRPLQALDATRPLFRIDIADVTVRAARLIPHDTLDDAMASLRVALAAAMVGAMEHLVEVSSRYAKTREQFGQPIGRFQAVKHRIVDMLAATELSRSLAYDAAMALESGREDRLIAAAAAKAYATERFEAVAIGTIQVHGGFGYTWESGLHLYLKRAKAWEHYAGSPSECREVVALGLGL